MIRIRTLIAFGLALAGLALALGACSGSASLGDDGSPSAAGGGTTASTTTYTNDRYGFTITYSDTLEQGEPAEGPGDDGSSLLDVVFADKNGPVVADHYVNAAQISVYGLAREVDPAEIPEPTERAAGDRGPDDGLSLGSEIVDPISVVESTASRGTRSSTPTPRRIRESPR